MHASIDRSRQCAIASRRVHTGTAAVLAPKHGKHKCTAGPERMVDITVARGEQLASDDERASEHRSGATQPPGTSHVVGIGAAVVLALYIYRR